MIRVLLVEDDARIANVIRYYLGELETYETVWAHNGAEALELSRDKFDVILMDIMLTDANGIELCAQLREWHHCPVIFVSALDDNDTIVRALEMGGDDYLVKPFDNRVLDARIKANIRRVRLEHEAPPANELSCIGFTLDAAARTVVFSDGAVPLVPMEFKLLRFLMLNPMRFFTSSELYREVWGQPTYGDARTVTAHIYNLRKKVEEDPKEPRFIINEWGKGYAFDPQGSGHISSKKAKKAAKKCR